jgi:endonuclease/exonuclease/phosphatase family metal-dependent hydrolase
VIVHLSLKMRVYAPRMFIALLCCASTGCEWSRSDNRSIAEPVARASTFKVVTYNTLHGLEVSKFWVRQVESDEDRLARFAVRIDQLAELAPDLILLQEVNPLPDMAEQYVRALKRRGLHYAQVHQVDACGLRIAPGLALVPGLNNGLAIFAKTPLRLRMVGSIKLSGSFGSCGDYFGLQLGELRYALLAEITAPGSEMPHLVATMHLHSGIERDARMLHDLMEAHKAGLLHHYDHLMTALTMDQQRRRMELHNLLDAIHEQQLHKRYAGIIFGGDLNFEAGSPEFDELEKAGFTDSASLAIGRPMWNT